MQLFAWLYFIPMLVIVVAGAVLVLRYEPAPLPQHGWPNRRSYIARVQSGFGRISGCILTLAAGTGVIIALVWPIGYGARHSNSLDHSIYRWVARHQTHWLHSAMVVMTKMSDNRQIQVVAAAFMVLMTLWWFRHRQGIAIFAPAVLIITAYEIEHQLQHTLKLLAARYGPVPPDLGAFPSGGVARLVTVYGLIFYLILRRLNLTRTKWAVAAWVVLAAATYTESYSRLYLGKHWFTDILGGLAFGILGLFVMIGAAILLDAPDREAAPAPGSHRFVAPAAEGLLVGNGADPRVTTGEDSGRGH